MKITSTEDLKDLKVTKDVSYKARNFIPVPPFMLHDLNQAILDYNGDSKEVLFVAIQVIQEFDKHMKDEGLDQSETARDSCVEISHWLHLATKGKINSIPTVACSVREVKKHFNHIQSVLGNEKNVEKSTNEVPSFDSNTFAKSIQKPLEIIAASSSSMQDFLSKLTQIQSTTQEKTTNSFGKLSDRVQNMFFVASSRGNAIPNTLNEEASLFFISSNFSEAQQYLEHYLEAKGIECAIPTSVTNLWLQGYFLWLNPLTPSGFATSVILSKYVIFNDSLHKGIMLDFSTKHEITKASLTKLTKTQVIYPTSIKLMVKRVEAITANLFFTEKSYLTKGLNHLLTLCKSNRTWFRTKLYLDKMFIAKFLFSIYDRINEWLSECGKNDTVDKTSMELVDFATNISNLKLNRYYCDLLQSIRTVARNDDKSTESVLPKDKKRKISGESTQLSRKMTKYESMNPEWRLKDGESWQTWRHRVNNAPTLSCSAKPCLKFHVKGTCFDNCTNRTSHRKLTGEDFKKTDEFIKKVRQDMKLNAGQGSSNTLPKLRIPPDKSDDKQIINLELIPNGVEERYPRNKLPIKSETNVRNSENKKGLARSADLKNTMMLLNNQKQTNRFKSELIEAGKTDTALLTDTDLAHEDTDATATLIKEAQAKVMNARGPHNEDHNSIAASTLKGPLLKQNHTFNANVPVPPAPTEFPMAQPQVPNPYQQTQLNLENTIKQLLHQPKYKLKDPEFSFEITPQAAASNLELLQRQNYDLKKLCNENGKRSATTFGSEFKNVSVLEKLLYKHPRWNRFKRQLTEGVDFNTDELNDKIRQLDLDESYARGNHKSAQQQN